MYFKKFLGLMIFILLLMNPISIEADGDLSDDFNDNKIDRANWVKFEMGGPTVVEMNNQLEITIPANSFDPSNIFGAGYASYCILTGDFDIQLDYKLLVWPLHNGVRVSIYTGPDTWAEVSRISWGLFEDSSSFDPSMPEVYLTFLNRAVVSISDTSGKLRLARVDGISIGYYFDSTINNWVEISSGPYTENDVHVYLGAYSQGLSSIGPVFGGEEAKVAFDNLIISGRRICKGRINPAHPGTFL